MIQDAGKISLFPLLKVREGFTLLFGLKERLPLVFHFH